MNNISIEKKIELLRNANIFSKLKDDELNIIAQYSERIDFKQDETVYKSGTEADEIYIIIDGEILITKDTEDGNKIDLAQFIAGECFGELDLLDAGKRNTTAAALKDSSVLIFPKKGILLSEVLEKHPKISASILHKFLTLISDRIRSTNRLISEKAPWLNDLRNQLYKDKLTGLYNRSYVDDELCQIISKTKNGLNLLVVKPDNFKTINDTYGHSAGDNSLKFLAENISSMLSKEEIAVRYKGDEFIIILPDILKEDALKKAESIRTSINQINIKGLTNGNDFFIKLSIGISNHPEHSDNYKDLIELSYKCMFEARNSGGDKVVLNK